MIPYKPLLDGAIELAQHKAGRAASSCSGRRRRRRSCAGATSTGTRRWPAPRPSTACPVARHRSALHPVHVGHDGHAEGRRARQRRPRRRAQVEHERTCTAWARAKCFWAASDIGWVVGHSYIVYAPLLKGCTTILYEGKPVGTPDPGAFWRVIAQHGVNALFTAPTAFRAIKKEDPRTAAYMTKYDLARLPHAVPRRRALRSRHACSGRADQLGVPVVDHWWQTETGVAHRRELRRPRHAPGQAGIAHEAGLGLRRPRARRRQTGDAGRPDRLDRAQAAAAARMPADALEQRRRATRSPISPSIPATT